MIYPVSSRAGHMHLLAEHADVFRGCQSRLEAGGAHHSVGGWDHMQRQIHVDGVSPAPNGTHLRPALSHASLVSLVSLVSIIAHLRATRLPDALAAWSVVGLAAPYILLNTLFPGPTLTYILGMALALLAM